MEQIIHIIPLGYEIDRAVKPFETENGLKANKAYLLSSYNPSDSTEIIQKHHHYHNKVKTRLENQGITVESIQVNLFDFFDVLSKVSSTIKKEQNQGNNVYVNVSSAGRLTAIGTAIAAMVHKARLYYVESNEYSDTPEKWQQHGSTIVEDLYLKFLDQFTIQTPNEIQQLTLVELYNREQMNTTEIIQWLSTTDSKSFPQGYTEMTRPQKITINMKTSRNILNKLEKQGYITKIKQGRTNYYTLTEPGKHMVALTGLLFTS